MFDRVRKNLTESSYGVLVLELVVVIVGILIAFQIDRWAEDRRERDQEHSYLVRLKEDLQLEIQSMNEALQYADSRIAAVLFLEEVLANPSLALEHPGAVPVAMDTATWQSWPQIDAFVYTELQSTGNLALIRSESLRRDLANHYTSIRHYERVGLDRDMQHQFERLTAGILTTAELQEIEEESWNDRPISVSTERGIDIAQSIAARRDAIDLLPNIAQHHAFNKKVIEVARGKAQKIIEQIEALIEKIDD